MISGKLDIHEAAFSGDVRALTRSLKEDMNPDCQDDRGQTPLHKAAMNGWLENVKLLIQEGASCDATDVAGCTPLHLAASNGYIAIVEYLLEHTQVDLQQKTKKGNTPKIMAKSRGQTKMVAFLNGMENKMDGGGQPWLAK